MANKAAVSRFNSKIDALEKETGFEYEIVLEDYEQSILDNRLYACWFENGSTIARVSSGDSVLVYQIAGSLDAVLRDRAGSSVKTFTGVITPYEDDHVSIQSDKDIEALETGKHASGYTLEFKDKNKVYVYAEDRALDPDTFEDPSIARCVLNKDIVVGLMRKADEEFELPDLPDSFDEDFSGASDDKSALDPLDAALESIEGNAGITAPEKPSVPKDEEDSPEMIGDIPTYEEYAETEKSNVEPEPKKKAKQQSKKTVGNQKKEAEKPADTEGEDVIERYDLLPLDLIGEFLDRFDEDREEQNFFSAIESFKKGKGSLLDAAVMFAKANYDDPVDAVTALAHAAEADAVKNGENAWQEGDVKDCINVAIKNYLIASRRGGNAEYAVKALWGLLCGAWMSGGEDR